MSSGLTAEQQIQGLRIAYQHVTDWSVAIDGGAHRGDWSAAMAKRFERVHAFEPADDMVAQLRVRFANSERVKVHHTALWSEAARVRLVPDPDHPLKTYGRFVQPDGNIEAIAIDNLDLPTCGLIKLDLEGAETVALRGAVKTLKRCKPVLIVECKQRVAQRFKATADDPGVFLAELGAQEIARHGVDRLYSFGVV